MTSRFVTLAFVVLLACNLPAGIAAGTPTDRAPASADLESPSVGAAATGSSSDVLHRTTTLRHRPTDTDVFETETTFRVPESVTELEIELERGATVESTTGFERTGERTLEWTGTTDEPTVRYTMPADRTGTQGASATGEGYSFVDTGEWAVVPVPDVAISLRRTDPVGIEETVRVDGPGATGGDIAFFGAVTERERTVDGERFRLAVPEAATLEESPDTILSALVDASDRLEVGARPDETFVVAVPDTVDWGPRGIQYGESDAWVVADEPLDSPNPAWLHEYVHVRQRFANTADGTTTETEWVVEGQADYHAGLLALEAGYTDFEGFSRLLVRGTESPYADGALADPGTWEHERTDYVKGALVAGEIDRQLRVATDGDRTLADVVRELNADDDAATVAGLLGSIEAYGGTAVRTDAERYTRTDATPAVWSRTDHRAAFDQSVASFEYGFGTGPIEVAGEEWPRWSASEAGVDAGTDEVIVVPAGESVTLPATVTNVGEREGTYDLTLGADGRTVAHRQGTLAPGGERSHRLSWTPAEPGTYVLSLIHISDGACHRPPARARGGRPRRAGDGDRHRRSRRRRVRGCRSRVPDRRRRRRQATGSGSSRRDGDGRSRTPVRRGESVRGRRRRANGDGQRRRDGAGRGDRRRPRLRGFGDARRVPSAGRDRSGGSATIIPVPALTRSRPGTDRRRPRPRRSRFS
ncbi:hypothetical protein C478_04219 [Natrinema thermotolerans DSM 11552]|nr:hypothetical protein C478_04219 [Natrinema thermotolerans DSM 11552]